MTFCDLFVEGFEYHSPLFSLLKGIKGMELNISV